MARLALRVRAEYGEMPGLHLTVSQAAKLFGVTPAAAHAVLETLRRASVLTCSDRGKYSSVGEASAAVPVDGSLHNASVGRLASLMRHWTWADEAKARFEHDLAQGWEYDEDPAADRPFNSYYHWCALLCGLSEAALEHGLLSTARLTPIRSDLEASLSELRACRQLFTTIPSSLEAQPRVVDLLRDEQRLGRLRRIHDVFGDALREEQMSRETELLDH